MPSSTRSPPPLLPPLSLHDALPISTSSPARSATPSARWWRPSPPSRSTTTAAAAGAGRAPRPTRRPRAVGCRPRPSFPRPPPCCPRDRKSTRLNSSHLVISYAVFYSLSAPPPPPAVPTRRSSDLDVLPGPVGDAVREVVETVTPFEIHDDGGGGGSGSGSSPDEAPEGGGVPTTTVVPPPSTVLPPRSEEHTSELQSPCNLVCRLLLALRPPSSPRCPYTTLFRSRRPPRPGRRRRPRGGGDRHPLRDPRRRRRRRERVGLLARRGARGRWGADHDRRSPALHRAAPEIGRAHV